MKKKNFLQIIFVEPPVWVAFFVFNVFCSYAKCCLRRLCFLFSPYFSPCTSSTYACVSCRDRLFVVSGKGSSGLPRTKKVGAASRLDDNLHTSISLQVVFSPQNLVCPKPYLFTPLKRKRPTRRKNAKNIGYARNKEFGNKLEPASI